MGLIRTILIATTVTFLLQSFTASAKLKEFKIIRDSSSIVDVQELLLGYNKLIKPYDYNDKTTVVKMALDVMESDYKNQKLIIKGLLTESWIDSRLQYPNDSDQAIQLPQNKIWRPEVLFINADLYQIQSHMTCKSTGEVSWQRNVQLLINCPVPIVDILLDDGSSNSSSKHACSALLQPQVQQVALSWGRGNNGKHAAGEVTVTNTTLIQSINTMDTDTGALKINFHINTGLNRVALMRIINNALDKW